MQYLSRICCKTKQIAFTCLVLMNKPHLIDVLVKKRK